MVSKGNQFLPLPVVNSDQWQSIPTSTGGKLRCPRRVISSYLYRW